jgi:hypothetical protein
MKESNYLANALFCCCTAQKENFCREGLKGRQNGKEEMDEKS